MTTMTLVSNMARNKRLGPVQCLIAPARPTRRTGNTLSIPELIDKEVALVSTVPHRLDAHVAHRSQRPVTASSLLTLPARNSRESINVG